MRQRENEKIRLGVSACLLGAEVRYDGGHKKDSCFGPASLADQAYLNPHPKELMLRNHV